MDDITLRNLDDVAPYAGPHAIPGIRFRPLRDALGVSSWGMSVLELDANCEGYPAHSHANDGHEEVYAVLRGSIVLRAGGKEHVLREGDFVRVPPKVERKFVTRAEGATLLALGGTPGQPYTPSMGQPAK
jgi:mannose-6-phosphate isomerase-like protein (cupin superfamily)